MTEAGEFTVMRGQKRVEDARRRAGVPRIHVCGKKARRRPTRMYSGVAKAAHNVEVTANVGRVPGVASLRAVPHRQYP